MKKYTLAISGLIAITLSSLHASDLPASTQGKEAIGMVNPSSRYQVDNGWNLFLNTEFLWWVAKEDGLYYVQSGYTGAQATTPVSFDGYLHKVKPHFRPGFRIGLRGDMAYDDWDIFLNWTWFQSHARDHAQGLLLTLWGHPQVAAGIGSTQGAVFAHALWDLHFNVLDLEMGRSFWVGKHLSLRPFLGIRGAWIDQHLDIHYDYTTTPIMEGKNESRI